MTKATRIEGLRARLAQAAQREKSLEQAKKEAERYRNMQWGRAKRALITALETSEPLRLLFVARFLGQGLHKERLADELRGRFAAACYAGDLRGSKRTQEALGALLQKERAFFVCSCAPVELPRMMLECQPVPSRTGEYYTVGCSTSHRP